MAVAKAVAQEIRKKYKDVIFIGAYGSLARREDKKYSDIELMTITKSKRINLTPFTFRGLPVDFYTETKQNAIKSIKDIDMLWPSRAGKYLIVKPLYGRENIINEFRNAVRSIKDAEFKKHASILLVTMREDVGKIKNAAESNNLAKCVEAATWLAYSTTLFVAFMNRKYYRRHGINSIEEAKTFKKLPEDYIALVKRLHTSKNMQELVKTAELLYDNCIAFAKKNDIKERHFQTVKDAIN